MQINEIETLALIYFNLYLQQTFQIHEGRSLHHEYKVLLHNWRISPVKYLKKNSQSDNSPFLSIFLQF